jgi:hypothetical protein
MLLIPPLEYLRLVQKQKILLKEEQPRSRAQFWRVVVF